MCEKQEVTMMGVPYELLQILFYIYL